MTQPNDSLTPLILKSELMSRLNVKNVTDTNNRLLDIIVEQSQIFQEACGRRFDEFFETRYFTPTHLSVGGDLYGLRELRLDMDLKSYTQIINGDASTINSGNVKLEPLNSPYHTTIRLNPYGIQFWYHAGVTDPHGSISVSGIWGYGGRWVNTGFTLSSGMDAVTTSLSTAGTLEAGMVLKIDSEYMYVSAIGTPNTVVRNFNSDDATRATTHAMSAPIYRWRSYESVLQCMTRLIQIALSQDTSPLFGQMIVGDVVFPVTVDSWPKDVVLTVQKTRLKRVQRLQAV